jgi:signal transduction histidine kinase
VRADERRVRQVLLNLVTNAIRYNRADGTVFVGWTVDDGQVRITVRDTGPGIAAEHLDRLFTPFDRLGRDSEEASGSGSRSRAASPRRWAAPSTCRARSTRAPR